MENKMDICEMKEYPIYLLPIETKEVVIQEEETRVNSRRNSTDSEMNPDLNMMEVERPSMSGQSDEMEKYPVFELLVETQENFIQEEKGKMNNKRNSSEIENPTPAKRQKIMDTGDVYAMLIKQVPNPVLEYNLTSQEGHQIGRGRSYILIEGIKVAPIYDSGSVFSMISKRIYDLLVKQQPRMLEKIHVGAIKNIWHTTVTCYGSCKIQIQKEQSCKCMSHMKEKFKTDIELQVYVIDMVQPAIMGNDFLIKQVNL